MADKRAADTCLLSEIVDAAAEHGQLRCAPDVEIDDGVVTLTVTIHPQSDSVDGEERLALRALYDELKFVVDMAQMRALATRYEIPSEVIEALVRRGGE